jgi:serine phosphatase RsbU (regulator of sigma subunit)
VARFRDWARTNSTSRRSTHIANPVGGDLYDSVQLDDGRVAVLFGDASGHGVAAGLAMAVAHTSFRTQLEAHGLQISITCSTRWPPKRVERVVQGRQGS